MNDWMKKLKTRLPAMILLAVTLLFWGFYDRYEPAGSVLLASPSLADADRLVGDCTETNGLFTLNVPASGKRASVYFRMPGANSCELIRARARIKVEDVVEGKYGWNCARVMVLQYDENNKWIPGTHGVVAEKDTKGWEAHEDVFEMLPEAAHTDFVIQQSGKSGTAWFDSIEAQPVRLRDSFAWWRALFAGLWLWMGALYFIRCRLHCRKLHVLILLNALAILAGAMMPGKWIEASSEFAKEQVAQAVEKKPPSPTILPAAKPAKPSPDLKHMDQFNELVGDAHRSGHFLLFASLCFLVYWSAALERQHRSYYFKVAFDIFIFASITEALQNLTLDRAAGISDLRTDIYGMLLAVVLFVVAKAACRTVLKLKTSSSE